MKKKILTVVALMSIVMSTPSFAIDLGDILKGGGIILGGGTLIKALAEQIDSFINTITLNKGAQFKGFTKVVPIVSLGSGTHLGAAQVGGTNKADVEKVKAVAQLEGEFSRVRARALIPVDSENPLQQFRRVQGVGVTAIIDVQL